MILIFFLLTDRQTDQQTYQPTDIATIELLSQLKIFSYAVKHPSENTISITLHQVDTHPQEKCDRPCNETVEAGITVHQCQKWEQ